MNDADALLVRASQSDMDWLNSRIKPDGWTASKKICFHESANFMDYLHGDVKDQEAWFACRYEYARESWQMWEASKVRDNARANGKLKCESDFWAILYEPEIESWIRVSLWAIDLLMCESFPHKDWNELSAPEREKIMFRARRKVEPLYLQWLYYDAGTLKRNRNGGFIDFPEFDELAARTEPVVKNVRHGETQKPVTRTEAMVQKSGPVYACLFRLDFSESPNLLGDRFVAWLRRNEIEQLWQKHKKQRNGKNRRAIRSTKIVQWHGSSHWCLFEVDLSATKGDLTKQFNKWQASREIESQLNSYNQEKRGTSDKWKDRLKDLAAWRLYRENGNSCDRANQFADQNRKKFQSWSQIHATGKKVKGKWPYKPSDPRPFRDAKQIKGSIPTAANGAHLFFHDDDYRHAKGETIKTLTDWIPSEFKQPFPELMKEWKKLDKTPARD